MLELAQVVLEITKSDSEIDFLPLPQDDPRQRKPDISFAKSLLSWEPTVDLMAGVSLTASYFKDLLSQ
jgi:UDP-glucuronate decarboxylase